jgi:hypothetical protein
VAFNPVYTNLAIALTGEGVIHKIEVDYD